MDEAASQAELHGHYYFSTERMAKVFEAVELLRHAKSYHLLGVGLNGKLESHYAMEEGSGLWTPSSAQFWADNSYPYGNEVNGTNYAIWDYGARGSNINVAVIDTNFLNVGEGSSSQLFGLAYGNLISYNSDCACPNISVGPDSSGSFHGRAVASTIFSNIGDSASIDGIAYEANPIIEHFNLTDNEASDCILQARNYGARVINMSWGRYAAAGEDPSTWAFYQQLHAAYTDGRVLVASNGNNGDGYCYPASYYEAIGVSSHNSSGAVSNFASECGFDTTANTVNADIYAGGSLVAAAGGAAAPNIDALTWCGTSFSAPRVSATCALLLQQGKISDTPSALSRLQAYARTDTGRPILDVLAEVSNP